ncbi:hypothetical protein Vafri_6715 [Volvox africanus]|uniref:Uncharacterized protein n=1 Tax=Volvox africanus TaxID=51714 RepID=A0A8J4B2Z2_9CHLO|nr:hypothetical protein Vafri_6715 [Volvox africanus]
MTLQIYPEAIQAVWLFYSVTEVYWIFIEFVLQLCPVGPLLAGGSPPSKPTSSCCRQGLWAHSKTFRDGFLAMWHGLDDDVVDLPEEVGSLAAWLPISVNEPRRDVVETRTAMETVLLVPLASQPITIPSRPTRKNQRAHKHPVFDSPTALSPQRLASSSSRRELSPLPGFSQALVASIEGSLASSAHPVSPTVSNPFDFLARRTCVWNSPSCSRLYSPNGDTCHPTKALVDSQYKPILERLMDGLQIATGPLGPVASLPLPATQVPMDLCKALSSPAAHITQEANIPKPNSCGDSAAAPKTLEFDVLRVITVFERSASCWAASLYTNEHDDFAGGNRLGCLPL